MTEFGFEQNLDDSANMIRAFLHVRQAWIFLGNDLLGDSCCQVNDRYAGN